MGMSGGGDGKSKAVPYINVTPLIDVLLVLLIIFMVISPQKPHQFETKTPQKPPEEQKPQPPDPLSLVVTLRNSEVDTSSIHRMPPASTSLENSSITRSTDARLIARRSSSRHRSRSITVRL
jgi:biopolymer transport protein ExbD